MQPAKGQEELDPLLQNEVVTITPAVLHPTAPGDQLYSLMRTEVNVPVHGLSTTQAMSGLGTLNVLYFAIDNAHTSECSDRCSRCRHQR